jgi:hypothetical protein
MSTAHTANFNGNDFASSVPGLRVIATNTYVPGSRTITTNPIARANKSVTSSAFNRERHLQVTVEIGQDSRELLDLAIDKLKTILQGLEKTLILDYGGGLRQWTATFDNNMAYSDMAGGHATIVIPFLAADGNGYDTTTTALVNSVLTGSTRTENVFFAGSSERQLPIITITLTTVTSGTSHGITITNPATSQAIVINRTTWTNADILVIDTAAKTVQVNGTDVAFTGPFPEWALGAGTLQYADTFTARKYTLNVIYRKRYA